MSDELIKNIRELYDNIMCFPNKVLDIFNDFFGEERVDMQEFYTFDEFLTSLSSKKISCFFPSKSAVFNSPEFKSLNKGNKDIIESLLDNGALDATVTSDETLASYFLPIMTTAIVDTITPGFILVHFPHVRITNEYDKFVDVNNLWAKVGIKVDGASIGYFTLNRSEYELSHMMADYLHSHVSGIPFGNFTQFKTPCLGSGPIRNTLATLAVGYDESIWQLFCLELDKYVRIESISGIPYRKLENIHAERSTFSGESTFYMTSLFKYISVFSREDMKSFVRYLIRGKKLKFNFVEGSYSFALSYTEYIILVSNEFIDWYNARYNSNLSKVTYTELVNAKILNECVINNGRIYYFRRNTPDRDYYKYEGAYVCTFKGAPINIHITNNTTDSVNKTVIVNTYLAEVIAKAVLTIVNYKYGREERRDDAGISTPAIYL